jgi:predicted membrane-bound spermidine synthase
MWTTALLLSSLLLLDISTTNAVGSETHVSSAEGGGARKMKAIGGWEEDIGFFQSIRVTNDSPLLKQQSKYQAIEVHRSEYYGKILVLDGVLQLTERDADSYNEMMAQIPMMQHKNPKRALVIGGGDGYVVSEVCALVLHQHMHYALCTLVVTPHNLTEHHLFLVTETQ